MPLPLKPGYNFNFDRIMRAPHFEMSAPEAYTDFYGISFMIDGERLIYSPTFTTLVQAGEIVFIPKNVPRRTTYISGNSYERILIKFTDSLIKDLLDTIGTETYEQLCNEHVLSFPPEVQKEIIHIFNEMEEEWNMYNKQSELILKGLLNKLIITCIRERIVAGTSTLTLEKKNGFLSNAIKYIKLNIRESLSLAETARHINISPSYLSEIFSTYLHTSFSDFVLSERISYAQKLITKTNLNMTEIAAECGFSSNSYFCDCFKKATGMSPLQYRKKM